MSDPVLHAALQSVGPDQAFDIAYHMYWPNGSDPFYLANPTENVARKNYYGVSATPTMKCDGSYCSYSNPLSSIQSRLPVPSPLWLDLSATLNGNNLNVTCTAVADVNISGSKVLHMVLLDRYSYIISPNGQNNHYHAMLDMAPSASGQTFTATAFDTVYYYATFPLDPAWSIDNLDMACFVQDNITKEVLQSHVEQVPVDFPGLYYMDYTLEDNGNNDGRAEPGETAYMYITLGNLEAYMTAVNVMGTLSTDDPDLVITTAAVTFPDIPNGGSGTNSDPFIFEVLPTAQTHPTTLHLEVIADPQATVMTADIDIYIGWPEILLVDDDGIGITEQYYQSALDNLGRTYEYWETNTQGAPSAELLGGYPIALWFTGWATTDALTPEERLLVETYLGNGGWLFISGQNIAEGLNTSAPAFLQDVLHANLGTANTLNKILNGIAGNPVGEGLTVNCNPGGVGSGTCTSPDGISVIEPADEAFIYSNGAHYGALTYVDAGGGKLVFFSFPFEAISAQSGTNTREDVLQAILSFFGTIPSVEPEPVNPSHYAMVEAYPNPFNPRATITFNLPRAGYIQLSVYDISGNSVASLIDGWRGVGNHEIVFDASGLASGIYLYRLKSGEFTTSGKMVLLK